MVFGMATALGFCRDGELGQCLAHYIMGSAFIAYAAILVIMLNLGGKWLERTGFSQEMLDSTVITIWVRDVPTLTSIMFVRAVSDDRALSIPSQSIGEIIGRRRTCNIPCWSVVLHTSRLAFASYGRISGANNQGVLWWTGGLLGMFLSRKGRRSFVPAVM